MTSTGWATGPVPAPGAAAPLRLHAVRPGSPAPPRPRPRHARAGGTGHGGARPGDGHPHGIVPALRQPGSGTERERARAADVAAGPSLRTRGAAPLTSLRRRDEGGLAADLVPNLRSVRLGQAEGPHEEG